MRTIAGFILGVLFMMWFTGHPHIGHFKFPCRIAQVIENNAVVNKFECRL